VVYRFSLPEAQRFETSQAVTALLDGSEVWIPRQRPKPKLLNVRPYIHEIRCDASTLELDLWVSQEGSVRGDELLRYLNLGSLLDEGAFLIRSELFLDDEMSPEEKTSIPVLPTSETRAAFERPLELERIQPELEPASTASEWGASPSGPEVE
jgi:hypothetical protein